MLEVPVEVDMLKAAKRSTYALALSRMGPHCCFAFIKIKQDPEGPREVCCWKLFGSHFQASPIAHRYIAVR